MNRRVLSGLLCGVLVWWVPGSPALGPVASGAVGAPADVDVAPRHASASVVSTAAGDPLVVESSVVATVGAADAASPQRTHGPTVVADVVLNAYHLAASLAPKSCHLDVSLLAAIGQVESGNLAGRRLDDDNRPVPPVLGPVLDGSGGFAAIADTDGGEWDQDTKWDRAVGPMQFIPSSWRLAGVDLDADGERNPQDIDDAAGAAMVYLCAGGTDLSTDDGLRNAVYSYNHSTDYVNLVLAWKAAFDAQGLELDLAEAPLLQLNAVQYQQVVDDVDASRARTARAVRASADDASADVLVLPGRPSLQEEEAGDESRPGVSPAPAPASATVSGGSTSGAASAGTGPAASSAAVTGPSASASPAGPGAQASSSPSAADSPAAQDPAPSNSPAAQAPAPSDSPAAQAPAPADSPAAQDPAPADSPAAQDPPPAAQDPAPADSPAAQDPAPSAPAAPDCTTTPTDPAAATPTDPAPTPVACEPPPAQSPAPSEPPATTADAAATDPAVTP